VLSTMSDVLVSALQAAAAFLPPLISFRYDSHNPASCPPSLMQRSRRIGTIHQSQHARAVTQPLTAYAQANTQPNQPAVPWTPTYANHHSSSNPPFATTLTIPDRNVNDWLSAAPHDNISNLSPSDNTLNSALSPSDSEQGLPLYTFPSDSMAGVEWKGHVMIPDSDMKTEEMYDPFNVETSDYKHAVPITVDPQAISSESASPPGYSTTKVRSAHRRAIEEKSSVKRKNAEHRLSNAISVRLGGTFVPGLANQLNQAAELLEQDESKIRQLEDENRMLRARLQNCHTDVKGPRSFK